MSPQLLAGGLLGLHEGLATQQAHQHSQIRAIRLNSQVRTPAPCTDSVICTYGPTAPIPKVRRSFA